MGECLCPCLPWDLGMSQSLLCVLWKLPVGTEGLALGGEVSYLPGGLSSFYQAEKWAHVPCPLLEIESQESNYRVPSRPQETELMSSHRHEQVFLCFLFFCFNYLYI